MLARVRSAAPDITVVAGLGRVLCFQFPWTRFLSITALLETAKVERTNPDVAPKGERPLPHGRLPRPQQRFAVSLVGNVQTERQMADTP
jgi:hypothetical protein